MFFSIFKWKQFNWLLFTLMIALIVLGLVLQSSLSSITFKKQLIFVFLGLFLFFLISFFDYRIFRSFAYYFYLLTLFLLLILLFLGTTQRGVKGWFSFGPLNFQPTELVKLSVIIVLARFWQELKRPLRFSHLLLSFILILPAIILVLLQPDLGPSLILLFIAFGLALMVSPYKKQILILIMILIAAGFFSWFFLKDYQQDRILSYLNLKKDPFGRDYQINQSIIAIGSGKIFGRGFNEATQSQLRFLPEGKTDFIFAVLAENFGFLGSFLFLALYFFFLFHLIKISKRVYDNFALVLVLGISLYFFSQLLINLGMCLGLLPVIGLSLPFLSYGGSSLLISMISVALIQSALIHQPPHQVGGLEKE